MGRAPKLRRRDGNKCNLTPSSQRRSRPSTRRGRAQQRPRCGSPARTWQSALLLFLSWSVSAKAILTTGGVWKQRPREGGLRLGWRLAWRGQESHVGSSERGRPEKAAHTQRAVRSSRSSIVQMGTQRPRGVQWLRPVHILMRRSGTTL